MYNLDSGINNEYFPNTFITFNIYLTAAIGYPGRRTEWKIQNEKYRRIHKKKQNIEREWMLNAEPARKKRENTTKTGINDNKYTINTLMG